MDSDTVRDIYGNLKEKHDAANESDAPTAENADVVTIDDLSAVIEAAELARTRAAEQIKLNVPKVEEVAAKVKELQVEELQVEEAPKKEAEEQKEAPVSGTTGDSIRKKSGLADPSAKPKVDKPVGKPTKDVEILTRDTLRVKEAATKKQEEEKIEAMNKRARAVGTKRFRDTECLNCTMPGDKPMEDNPSDLHKWMEKKFKQYDAFYTKQEAAHTTKHKHDKVAAPHIRLIHAIVVLLSIIVILSMMFQKMYSMQYAYTILQQQVVPRDVSGLNSFAEIQSMTFGYQQQEDWIPTIREAKDTKCSPMYDPKNYIFKALVGDEGTVLTTTLDDVRLVFGEEENVALRAKGTDKDCYVELNVSPEIFERTLDSTFYPELDNEQIVFIQQYLSDRYLDTRVN